MDNYSSTEFAQDYELDDVVKLIDFIYNNSKAIDPTDELDEDLLNDMGMEVGVLKDLLLDSQG